MSKRGQDTAPDSLPALVGGGGQQVEVALGANRVIDAKLSLP